MSDNFVFVYANKLNPVRDAFPEIQRAYPGRVRREYIVDSAGVQMEDVSIERVRARLAVICSQAYAKGEKSKVILAGYSPLVALMHQAAGELGVEEAYFIRDASHKLVEAKLT